MHLARPCFASLADCLPAACWRKGLLLAGVVTLGSLAQAQVLVNVKIRTSDGNNAVFQAESAAVLGTNADYWNGFGYTSSTPYNAALVDSLENATGVTLTVSNSNGVGGMTNANLLQLNSTTALGLGAYMNATTPLPYFTITLNGLDPLSVYRFIGYSAGAASGAGVGGTWAVTTGSLLGGITTVTGANPAPALSAGAGVAYADFSVQSDASGRLVITDTALTGARGLLQGFQIQTSPIPEPSTYALLFGLATGGLVAFRRWRRA